MSVYSFFHARISARFIFNIRWGNLSNFNQKKNLKILAKNYTTEGESGFAVLFSRKGYFFNEIKVTAYEKQ